MKISSTINRLKYSGGIYNRLIASVSTGLFQLARALSNTASASESGVILNQDYVASDYFADDFVGTKTTF